MGIRGPAVSLIIIASLVAQTPEAGPSGSRKVEPEISPEILKIQRVYVDRFAGGETAVQLRDMIISSLQTSGLFVITENEQEADAVLRGSGEDLVFTDTFSSSESLNARSSVSTGTNPDRTASDRRSRYTGFSVGQDESTRIAERKHEATASVRLVNKRGDVVWSTIQESRGSKFRGASADVAYKISRQLLRDYERARKWSLSK
jgi:hypothetical protein